MFVILYVFLVISAIFFLLYLVIFFSFIQQHRHSVFPDLQNSNKSINKLVPFDKARPPDVIKN